MKLLSMTITAITLLALSLTNVYAGDRRVGGLLIGGGTGAVIGNKLETHHGTGNRHPQIVVHSQRYDRQPRSVFRHNSHNYPRYYHNRGNCRKIVTIEKRRHETRRVVSTVCNYRPRNSFKNHYSYR